MLRPTGANPGFLKRGFINIKVWGFALLILSHFPKYPMKKNNLVPRPNYLIFIRYLKSGGGGGVLRGGVF